MTLFETFVECLGFWKKENMTIYFLGCVNHAEGCYVQKYYVETQSVPWKFQLDKYREVGSHLLTVHQTEYLT